MKKLESLSVGDVAYSANMAIASAISYWITTYALSGLVGSATDYLGWMWATVATIFVFRDTRMASLSAGTQRFMATCISFALCEIYFLIFPFKAVGMAALPAGSVCWLDSPYTSKDGQNLVAVFCVESGTVFGRLCHQIELVGLRSRTMKCSKLSISFDPRLGSQVRAAASGRCKASRRCVRQIFR